VSHTPEHWRLRKVRLRLQGARCVSCDCPVFPPRPHCPICAVMTGRGSMAYPYEVMQAGFLAVSIADDTAIVEISSLDR